MKRFLIVGMLVVIGGCSAPSSPPQQQKQAAPAAAAVAAGPNDPKKRTITMYKNDDHLGNAAPAACLGSVTPYRGAKIKRKQGITWKIVNDDDTEKCESIDFTAVEVRFMSAILLDPDTNMPTDRLKGKVVGMHGEIKASIVDNATAVPNGVYKYLVYYINQVASEDPELDIDGDCGGAGCGPGGD